MSSPTVFYAEFESASHLYQLYNKNTVYKQKQNIFFSKTYFFVNCLFDPGMNLAYKKQAFSHLKPIKK